MDSYDITSEKWYWFVHAVPLIDVDGEILFSAVCVRHFKMYGQSLSCAGNGAFGIE